MKSQNSSMGRQTGLAHTAHIEEKSFAQRKLLSVIGHGPCRGPVGGPCGHSVGGPCGMTDSRYFRIGSCGDKRIIGKIINAYGAKGRRKKD